MTLIIGIKCKDGVLMASDGAATLGSMGIPTARQPSDKLAILQDKIIVGVSGFVGLGQRFTNEIDKLSQDTNFQQKNAIDAMVAISEKLREHINTEVRAAVSMMQLIGVQNAQQDALSATLVAIPIQNESELFQYTQQGSPERATEELPFVSIGIGQQLADPFLGFIRRIFWPNGCPTINEASFAAYWTLKHSISLSPGGIADPLQMTALIKNGDNWVTKEYSPQEINDHEPFVGAAEDSLRRFKENMQSEENAEEIPQPS
jgi:ATP-dependent protease HslVU (ClpYQ) peptidase subunit